MMKQNSGLTSTFVHFTGFVPKMILLPTLYLYTFIPLYLSCQSGLNQNQKNPTAMKDSFKPENYNSVSPYFIVDGAQRMIDLLKQLFNATELRRYAHPDGKIMHVEVRIDDSVIMIADSNEKYPPNTHLMHVYLPNVDDTYKKAIDLGCEAVEEPKQKDGDPDKRGMFTDFAGNVWAVATQLSN